MSARTDNITDPDLTRGLCPGIAKAGMSLSNDDVERLFGFLPQKVSILVVRCTMKRTSFSLSLSVYFKFQYQLN